MNTDPLGYLVWRDQWLAEGDCHSRKCGKNIQSGIKPHSKILR
jgi:hypothetical protein